MEGAAEALGAPGATALWSRNACVFHLGRVSAEDLVLVETQGVHVAGFVDGFYGLDQKVLLRFRRLESTDRSDVWTAPAKFQLVVCDALAILALLPYVRRDRSIQAILPQRVRRVGRERPDGESKLCAVVSTASCDSQGSLPAFLGWQKPWIEKGLRLSPAVAGFSPQRRSP